MDMVNIKINGIDLQVPQNYTILQAAKDAGINIPTLCFLKDINAIGACRMCLVEVKGAKGLVTACVYPVNEGMEVYTNTEKVRKARKTVLELTLSNHDKKCLTCTRNQNCELQKLCDDLGVKDIAFEGEITQHEVDALSPSIVRDNNKCILCRRCVAVCKKVQTVGAIDAQGRGFTTKIGSTFELPLSATDCVNCGQCIAACPVGALYEKDSVKDVWAALADESKHVVVQTAPAVRAALGEEFGMPIGTRVTGKMVTALKYLGFDKVFDTDFGADVTIMEEGTEFINRVKNGGKLPLITSCSPGWVKFCEHNFPDFLDNLSSAKSPHEMFGAILKSYYAEKTGIDPKDIYVVSVMPCTAKKFEAQREELSNGGYADVDAVLTTREFAKMIKEAGIEFDKLADSVFDSPFGDAASGAAVIFGATGGVMEAALRTVSEVLTGKSIERLEFTEVRGTEGIKEATITVGDLDVKVAVAHGLGNARALLEKVRSGEANYHFIEIMGCPGGCVTGGGQPIVSSKTLCEVDLKAARAKALYDEDESLPLRKSHENPFVKALYDEFLGEPCGHKAHELLHTHYSKRTKITQ